ncbi:LysR family transcriptional regulator [Paraburkholderia sp. J63]|uniref:LysR family transcriptional regulator n=1 Tax=Paraburkholderia sp. J63 TaxID=2805434 RepID=UPI002ABDF630|nr:LysR family transcriptional regulator [Paraburkholderia sp. J63]
MARDNLSDLQAFLAVARERSFTRAAAQLGVSQSALSHTLRALEARLGLRLLTRTTRSVSTTEAGERLFQAVSPRFEQIDAELAALADLRDKPAGTIRITAIDHTVNTVIWPRLKTLLPAYPDIKVEITVDYGLRDIVADRYDIGVRLGDQVAKDMIAVRISPDLKMAIVASPAYLAKHKAPKAPQDLLAHNCITLRLTGSGGLYAWELKKDDHALQVRVDGQLTFNAVPQMLDAALDGFGLAFLPEDVALPHLRAGRLKSVLKDWCPVFPGYHAFYPSRRQSSRALGLVIDALRYRDPRAGTTRGKRP